MTDFYSVIEDGEETFIGIPIPREKNSLYKSIIRFIIFYINGYISLLKKDYTMYGIVLWKLNVYNKLIDELISIVGHNDDTKKLKRYIKQLIHIVNMG